MSKSIKALNLKNTQIQKENKAKKANNLVSDASKAFGRDITQAQLNYKQNFILHQKYNVNLPNFLKQKSKTNKELAPYEDQIIEYIINTNQEYDFAKRYKNKGFKNIRRIKIIEFLHSKCIKLKLKKKTLFLSAYIYDKYIQTLKVRPSSEDMAFIAHASLFIAMKWEQIYPPYLQSWVKQPEQVIMFEARILKALGFKLMFTSAQQYLQLYVSKKEHESRQKILLYQSILELYLITGEIYKEHPLKVVQQITDSFRSTIFMENQTKHAQIDKKIKRLIINNKDIWENILENNEYYTKHQLN